MPFTNTVSSPRSIEDIARAFCNPNAAAASQESDLRKACSLSTPHSADKPQQDLALVMAKLTGITQAFSALSKSTEAATVTLRAVGILAEEANALAQKGEHCLRAIEEIGNRKQPVTSCGHTPDVVVLKVRLFRDRLNANNVVSLQEFERRIARRPSEATEAIRSLSTRLLMSARQAMEDLAFMRDHEGINISTAQCGQFFAGVFSLPVGLLAAIDMHELTTHCLTVLDGKLDKMPASRLDELVEAALRGYHPNGAAKIADPVSPTDWRSQADAWIETVPAAESEACERISFPQRRMLMQICTRSTSSVAGAPPRDADRVEGGDEHAETERCRDLADKLLHCARISAESATAALAKVRDEPGFIDGPAAHLAARSATLHWEALSDRNAVMSELRHVKSDSVDTTCGFADNLVFAAIEDMRVLAGAEQDSIRRVELLCECFPGTTDALLVKSLIDQFLFGNASFDEVKDSLYAR